MSFLTEQELRSIAQALSDAGRPAEAEEAYSAILHLSGADADALHGVGLGRVHQGRWTAGYRSWRRGAVKAPGSGELEEIAQKERVYRAGYPPGGAQATRTKIGDPLGHPVPPCFGLILL